MNNQPLYTLLHKKTSRKEFIIYLGLAFVTITGIASILNAVKYHTGSSRIVSQTKGYGSSPYGK